MPLRILAVTPSYAPCIGGAEVMLGEICERLAARGHQVTVLAANGSNQKEILSPNGGRLSALEVIRGVTVRRFSPEHVLTKAVRSAQELPGGWRLSRALLGEGIALCSRRPSALAFVPPLLADRDSIVLSLNWIWPPAYGAYLARRLRRFRLVGVPIFHIARSWAERPLYHPMLAACDRVLTLTSAEARFVEERCDRPTSVVGTGVDPARFARRDGAALRRTHGVGGAPVIGFVGRQDGLKGVLVLIEAMKEVWRVRPDAFLLLAGQSAHRSDEVRAALESLTPAQHQRVIDLPNFPESDKASIFDACDIVALPSVEESFGMVFLEAWVCRKPVVGARIPSTECVLEEGRDGLIARAMDQADLARCLLELITDPERARAMGEAGYRKTLQLHTWDIVTDRWEAAIQEI